MRDHGEHMPPGQVARTLATGFLFQAAMVTEKLRALAAYRS